MTASDPMTISVAGYSFTVEFAKLPTKNLKLDHLNPRIRYLAETKGISPKTNLEICNLLFQDEDIQRLRQDIKRDKGLHDPILVNKDGTIIEGNSRAACYMTLLEKDGKSGAWDTIPAMVLREQMKGDDVAMLQGYYHVRMKNKWATYAKAAHVYRLFHEHSKTVDQIRQATGMHEKNIKVMIRTYETMRKYSFEKKAKKDPDQVVRTFSYVQEFEKSADPAVVKFREKESNHKVFTEWVRDGKFERGEDVRKLGSVLKSAQALKAFVRGGIKAAKHIVSKIDPSADLRQYRLVKKLARLLHDGFAKEVHLVRDNPTCRKMLEDLNSKIDRVLSAAKK